VYYYDSTYAPSRVARNSNPSLNFVKENSSYSYRSAYAKPGATGFRLPTINEWELAARWRNNATNTVSGYSSPWFTQGDSASGAAADYTDTSATGAVAWYNGNASDKTHPVKGKAANALGLYDMSGNVFEWCFDWHPSYIGSYRFFWGGCWLNTAEQLQVGGYTSSIFSVSPDYLNGPFGIRPARTAP
jgi:formylglycine-generating enzyme required for sulfatase activity